MQSMYRNSEWQNLKGGVARCMQIAPKFKNYTALNEINSHDDFKYIHEKCSI